MKAERVQSAGAKFKKGNLSKRILHADGGFLTTNFQDNFQTHFDKLIHIHVCIRAENYDFILSKPEEATVLQSYFVLFSIVQR